VAELGKAVALLLLLVLVVPLVVLVVPLVVLVVPLVVLLLSRDHSAPTRSSVAALAPTPSMMLAASMLMLPLMVKVALVRAHVPAAQPGVTDAQETAMRTTFALMEQSRARE